MSDESDKKNITICDRCMSASVKELASALSKAQAALHSAKRDKTNPHFASQYTTLSAVWEVVREPLTKNGLSVTQLPTVQITENTSPKQTVKGVVIVTTILMHTSGEWISSKLAQPLKAEFMRSGTELPPSAHQIGAAITYSRRYALASMLGVASEEDDDGNTLSSDRENFSPPPNLPASRGTRTSIYTGQEMDSEQGKVAHHAAAAATRAQPPQQPPPARASQPAPTPHPQTQPPTQQPQQPPAAMPGISHPGLAAAMQRDRIMIEELDGYLRGEMGKPRIKNPVIVGGMTLNAMGAEICNGLLKPATWKMICDRIRADPDRVPF